MRLLPTLRSLFRFDFQTATREAFAVTSPNSLPLLVMPRQRVGAKRRPMTGSGGASSTPRLLGSITDVSGILVHPPEPVIRPDRLAADDGWGRSHSFAISPQVCARYDLEFPALSQERAQGKPGAHRTRGPRATKKHAAEPQVQADHPAFPAQWFYGLYRALPGDRALLPPSFRGNNPQTLAPASGRQDHTTSPSASSAFASRAISVHRIPPHVRDDRETPLCRDGTKSQYSCFYLAVKRKF